MRVTRSMMRWSFYVGLLVCSFGGTYGQETTSRATPAGDTATGGGAQADFDTLIDLIQATVAPDSWDDVGGEGAIQSFPGGVYVDADGLLRGLDRELTSKLEPHWADLRETQRSNFTGQVEAEPCSRRVVSLTELLQVGLARARLGQSPTVTMQFLGGMSRLDELVIDAERDEVLMVGPAGPWSIDPQGRVIAVDSGRPVLRLDDVMVLLANAFDERGQFSCSITPTPTGLAAAQTFLRRSDSPIRPQMREAWVGELRNTLGRQRIEVTGIDAETRVARLIVEADHHMKQVGIGLTPAVDGLVNYLDRVAALESQPPLDVLRWWFTLHPHAVTMSDHEGHFVFGDQAVQLLSENELLTRLGRRVHTGKAHPLNARFAADFTRRFIDVAEEFPVYHDLDNVFRIAIAMALIRDSVAGERCHQMLIEWQQLTERFGPRGRAPRWVDSIVNHKTVNAGRFVAVVSGGVQFDGKALIVRTSADRRPSTVMRPGRNEAVERWWWDLVLR